MNRSLTLEFVRVTEAAAIASARWMGRGNKEAADDAAVTAMRAVFDTVDIDGKVVIGEGEMDEAPMLYIGEELGLRKEHSTPVDIAVDPLEGTNIVAKGTTNSIAVLAASDRGGLLHAPDMYMDKICVGPKAKGRIDITRPVAENLQAVADALEKDIEDLTVVVLDRERHSHIISEARRLGCRIRLITDGDVAPSVAAAIEGTGIDMLMGVGGAPEGVLSAAALKCLGGDMQARLWPEPGYEEEDIERAKKLGVTDINKVLTLDDLVPGDDVIFAATGVTSGELLDGVVFLGRGAAKTQTVVMRSRTGTVRFIEATHRFDKKPSWRYNRK